MKRVPLFNFLAAAALLPLSALAQSYGASGAVNATTTLEIFGAPTQTISNVDSFSFIHQPEALQPHGLNEVATVGGSVGSARALFEGAIGTLKAYSSAAYAYGYDAQGHGLFRGYASATAQGSFADTVLVGGAGLRLGTPVNYRVEFRIDGTLSSPSFEIGGFLNASAVASARLTDLQSGQEVSLNWDASRQAVGLYTLTLATQVGHSLQFTGSLATSAGVTHYAQTGRSAEADFYHSAYYALAPSVAGLNTVGASGHEFAVSNVPEPASWALFGAGLLALLLSRSRSPARA
jgi:hypothetical protein